MRPGKYDLADRDVIRYKRKIGKYDFDVIISRPKYESKEEYEEVKAKLATDIYRCLGRI